MADISRAVLITGCSTGIGRATAEHLAKRGLTVYATARSLESIEDLKAAGCKTLALDVTDEDSMRAAVAAVEEAEGAVDALVNNAGYSQSGAVETVAPEDVRRQFETNVFGLLRMCQLVLPGMRRQGHGRIVNVSSMGGKLTFPGGGIYHATKHAVEAMSDAMRFEVKGFGVDVSIIEPGLIKTQFAETAVGSVSHEDGPYAEFNTCRVRGHRGRLRGTVREAGRRAGGRRQGDREGDHGAAAAVALPRHAVRARVHDAARPAAGPGLGPGGRDLVPAPARVARRPRRTNARATALQRRCPSLCATPQPYASPARGETEQRTTTCACASTQHLARAAAAPARGGAPSRR